MYDATPVGSFLDDVVRRLVRRVVRFGAFLDAHDHAGVQASLSEVMALGELAEVPSLTQSELGELLGLEKSTISRLASGLERRGWVHRHRDAENRRFARLQLTAEGRATAEHLGAYFRAHHEALLSALTPGERTALITGLAALIRVLDENGTGLDQHGTGPDEHRTGPDTAVDIGLGLGPAIDLDLDAAPGTGHAGTG